MSLRRTLSVWHGDALNRWSFVDESMTSAHRHSDGYCEWSLTRRHGYLTQSVFILWASSSFSTGFRTFGTRGGRRRCVDFVCEARFTSA
jgi:hypothetical protein